MLCKIKTKTQSKVTTESWFKRELQRRKCHYRKKIENKQRIEK